MNSTQLDQLWWDEFKKYFNLSEEHLLKCTRESELEKDPTEKLHRLRLHFLFPNLCDEERNLLFSAICCQDEVQREVSMLGEPNRVTNKKLRSTIERRTSEQERELLDFRQRIERSGLWSKLTPLQKRIIKERIFKIHIPEWQSR